MAFEQLPCLEKPHNNIEAAFSPAVAATGLLKTCWRNCLLVKIMGVSTLRVLVGSWAMVLWSYINNPDLYGSHKVSQITMVMYSVALLHLLANVDMG